MGHYEVLVVEDSDFDFELLCRSVKKMDFDIELVRRRTLSSAMEVLEERSFDAVILDLGLPDSVNGIDAFVEMTKKFLVKVKGVLILTGRFLSDDEFKIIHQLHAWVRFIHKDDLTTKSLDVDLQYLLKKELSASAIKVREVVQSAQAVCAALRECRRV